MARVISDECVSCGTCEGECPVGAIAMGADHYDGRDRVRAAAPHEF